MGLSKISKKCRECRYVDTCQNKRMEAFAYIGEESFNTNTLASTSVNAGAIASESAIQSHDYRNIKISTGITVSIDLEKIKKELIESRYPTLFQYGG